MKTILNKLMAVILIAGMIILSSENGRGGPNSLLQRIGAVGFSIGTKGYIGTGYGYSNQGFAYKKDFWEYNPANDSWTQKADFGGTARIWAVGFGLGSKGYIGTGDNNGFKKDFWEYNPATNKWTRKADFGGTARKLATGFGIATTNKGYIGTGGNGGSDPVNLQDFWEYNPVTDTWLQIADFPGTARYAAVGFSIGTKGYAGTGINYVSSTEFNFLNDLYEYNPAENTWTSKASLNGPARAFAVGFNIVNKGYIGTGNSSGGFLTDFWEYDPTLDIWLQTTDFGGVERDCATGFSIGTKGYIGTGLKSTTPDPYLKDFWEYNQVTNVWTQKTDLGSKHKGPLKDVNALTETGPAINSELIVYPNPSPSVFNFRLNSPGKELVTITIFDMTGKLINEYSSLPPDEIITVGENLDAGIYVAVLTQGTFRKTVKLNKVH
jgi:N-acetylneuraminic acid mutarotase